PKTTSIVRNEALAAAALCDPCRGEIRRDPLLSRPRDGKAPGSGYVLRRELQATANLWDREVAQTARGCRLLFSDGSRRKAKRLLRLVSQGVENGGRAGTKQGEQNES